MNFTEAERCYSCAEEWTDERLPAMAGGDELDVCEDCMRAAIAAVEMVRINMASVAGASSPRLGLAVH